MSGLSISVEGVTGLLKHPLFDMQKRRRKVEIFLEELAQIGVRDATIRFAKAEYDGVNDVVVHSPEWIDDHTLQIVADGQSILFIEFGTGIYNPVEHPRANALGMNRGEYGKGNGMRRGWVYYGEPGTNGELVHFGEYYTGAIFTRGNNANMCMFLAADEMRKQIARTAERVFTK